MTSFIPEDEIEDLLERAVGASKSRITEIIKKSNALRNVEKPIVLLDHVRDVRNRSGIPEHIMNGYPVHDEAAALLDKEKAPIPIPLLLAVCLICHRQLYLPA